MGTGLVGTDLDVEALTVVIEEFAGIFIRLPSVERLSFTTLSVLHTLAHTGPRRLCELTATEQVTQSAITQLVTRLERDGLVERRLDPTDGRAVLVNLTASGAKIVEERHADRTRRLDELMAGLGAQDRADIASALPALARVARTGRLPGSPAPAEVLLSSGRSRRLGKGAA
jgi:DNA-binding MarR family transcriptional regulator